MLKPVNHNSASSQIYEQLLHYIISGEWPVGTRLPSEKDLAEQFGVSRVPIREALQRLRAIGVVRSLQGSGSFVCGNSPLSRMEPLPATLQSRLSTFSWVALISPDPATLKLILRASSCLSKFIVLLPAILISSLSVLRGLLAINSPPPTALISFSSRELVFISHTVGWRLSP